MLHQKSMIIWCSRDSDASVSYNKTLETSQVLGRLEDTRNTLESAERLQKTTGNNASNTEVKGYQEIFMRIVKYMKNIDNL